MLSTKRLVLRPWAESDAEALFECAKDPRVGLSAGWKPHESVEESREVIKTVLCAVGNNYAVVLKDSGKPVGCIGLLFYGEGHTVLSQNEAELGYWLAVPYWGQGLIPEAAVALLSYAFDDLGLTAVWCGNYQGNTNSERVQQKCGFVYSHSEIPDGETKEVLFSRLTSEQFRLNKKEV